MKYYDIKESDYYTHLRTDILPYIPKLEKARFLDVGSSSGNTLCFLKENGIIEEAVGIDFMSLPGSNQQNKLIDRFIIADIQKKDLDLPKEHFDIILCADVLEHLLDPWDSLEYLKTFLKKDGLVIISLPNFREIKVMYKIFFKGDFQYAPSGILDKTHLRFFCKKNVEALVRDAGFTIEKIAPSFKTCPLQKKKNMFSKLTFGIFDPYLAQQYIISARKK